jgi:hypothetical protein
MGFRSDVRSSLFDSLVAFAAANPSLVDRVYQARPPSIADTRAVFLASTPMAATHTSGVRQKVTEMEVVCSVHLADNEETTDNLEALADGVEDWITDHPHLVSGYHLTEWVRATPIELNEGGVIIPAFAITCQTSIQEGRG